MKDEKLQYLLTWSPHTGQQQVLSSFNEGSKRIVVAAGVRWGKSAICGYIALKVFLEGLLEISKGNRDSVKVWIVAPSYELTKKVFEYIVKWFLKIHPESAGSISYRPYPQIKLAEGAWIQGKSATEPHSLLGEELDLIIVDEAAVIPPDIWETYLSARLISRSGKVIFISTPFGQNWFYHEYLKAKENKAGFAFRTLDNPTLMEEGRQMVEKLQKEIPKQIYLQNYDASFLPDAASVFPTIEQIIRPGTLRDSIIGRKYVMGVDLGRHEDYTVLTIIDTWDNSLCHIERISETSFPIQKARIIACAKRYNNAMVIVDSTGVGLPISEDLMREGTFVITDYKFSGKSKTELVQKGIVFIEQNQVSIPPDIESNTPLVEEAKAFGYNMTESGNISYSAPQGLHDDCIISFLLAIWGLQGKPSLVSALAKELQKGQRKKESYI